MYFIDSIMKYNYLPEMCSIDALLNVCSVYLQTMMQPASSTLVSVRDLPGFEIFNKLEVGTKVKLPPDIRVSRTLDVPSNLLPYSPADKLQH